MDALSPWVFAGVVIVTQMTGWGCGRLIRKRLPPEHLAQSTRDAVMLAVGMVATLAALVLGLMISSAKTSFDADRQSVIDIAADILLMDRVLAHYGEEAKQARDILRGFTHSALEGVGEEAPAQSRVIVGSPMPQMGKLQATLLALKPVNDSQRSLQTRALTLSAELERARVLMGERSDGSIPSAFLIVLLIWLAMLYVALAIFSPVNATVTAAAVGGSLAFAAAVFLILELDRPFQGVVRVPTDSLVGTLQLLGRQ
jgi:hypothetical protein